MQNSSRQSEWAQAGIGSPIIHRLFYILMKYGGLARGYHLANIAAGWYVLYPSIRQRCAFYLSRRFPQRTGPFQRFIDSFRLVRAFATTLVDIKVRAMFGSEQIEVDFPDRHRLAEMAARETGFVLIHAHVGCWQVAMTTVGHFEKDVSVVMIPDPHTAAMFGPRVSLIDPREGLASSVRMTESLLSGNILAMMGDRTIGADSTTATVQFLGKAVRFPINPYRLASATGAPVVVLTAPRVDKRKYELRLARIIEVPPGLGRKADAYAPYVQQFADALAEFVAEYPWQYANFFNLWADSPTSVPPSREETI